MPEKKCNGCGVANKPTTIPYAVHESNMTRAHKEHKWLVGVIVLLIVLLFGSNCAWLWHESQFETVQEVTDDELAYEFGMSTRQVSRILMKSKDRLFKRVK